MSLLTSITNFITPFRKSSNPTKAASARSRHAAAGGGPTHLHQVQSGKIVKKRGQDQHKGAQNGSVLNRFLDSLDVAKDGAGATSLEGDTLVQEESPDEPVDQTMVDPDDQLLRSDDIRFKDFSDEEIWLFNKLSRRGTEPLLPAGWQLDFGSFPDDLFSPDEKAVFITNLNTNIVHATREFAALIDAGPRCRDALSQNQIPERHLKRGIERYNKWALRDAKIHPKSYIDLVSVVAAKPQETVPAALDRLSRKLHKRAREWREKLRHPDSNKDDAEQVYTQAPPTLYGFLIKYSVVAIVTHDASKPDAPVRNLVTSNLQMLGYDVWAALAIAIVCVRARNQLLAMGDQAKLEGEMPDEEEDPDA